MALGVVVGNPAAFREDIAKRVELEFRSVLRGKAGGGPLEELTQGIELQDLLLIELGDGKAADRVDLEQAFCNEAMHGLADRRATDAKPFGEFRFAEALTRLQGSRANEALERVVDELRPRKSGLLHIAPNLVRCNHAIAPSLRLVALYEAVSLSALSRGRNVAIRSSARSMPITVSTSFRPFSEPRTGPTRSSALSMTSWR